MPLASKAERRMGIGSILRYPIVDLGELTVSITNSGERAH
jgi:hypothetical protein